MKRDIEQLRLISMFHYIMGILITSCSLIATLNIVMVFSMAERGWGFQLIDLIIPATILLITIFFSGSLFLAGYFLSRHRNRFFCLVVAGIAILYFPFGTVLGIFTIMILMRDSAIILFEENRAAGNKPRRRR